MKESAASLYATSVRHVARNFDKFSMLDLSRHLTESMRFDVYWEIFTSSASSSTSSRKVRRRLIREMAKLDVFFALLHVGHRRMELHNMFQTCNAISSGFPLIESLVNDTLHELRHNASQQYERRLTTSAFNFACFLIDGGWYLHAEKILRKLEVSPIFETEVRIKLLHVFAAFSKFGEAESAYRQLLSSVSPFVDVSFDLADDGEAPCRQRLRSVSTTSSSSMMTDDDESESSSSLALSRTSSVDGCPNLSSIYSEFSSYFFVRSNYRQAFDWSLEAVKLLHNGLSPRILLDVLRQASKSSVVRRQFAKAEILIQEAVLLAKETYGEHHLKYADCLMDYGFYLLNVDGVAKSVQAYKSALIIRKNCLGSRNLLVALAYEELAYATYVYEYSTGRFDEAKDFAEKSLDIMTELLPDNHLLLASSQRVLALILEEIAIDNVNKSESRQLLKRAEELHLSALSLAVSAFGEMNVQTAKHYGNLGRLYQTMEKYSEAEAMHLKAIEIKETILGKNDYEVALSIGHLASLYNYDLNAYSKAEVLYLRSIEIGVKLFGPGYSGLEYDYRGLIRVYQETQDWTNFFTYQYKLRDWKTLREERESEHGSEPTFLTLSGTSQSINKIVQAVLRCSEGSEEDASTDLAGNSNLAPKLTPVENVKK